MRTLALLLISAGFAAAANYSYSIYNPSGVAMQQSNLTNWSTAPGTTNGSVSCGGGSAPCTLYSATAGSLIYTGSAATAYEVAMNVDPSFTISGGGVQIYLHASSNALRSSNGSSDTGSFDVVSLYSPTCATDGSCSASFAYYERSGSTTTLKAVTTVPYISGTRFRAVAYGTTIGVLVNDTYYGFSSGLSGGYAGIGASLNTAGAIDVFQIGPQCTTVPATVQPSEISSAAYPTSVSLSWTPPTEPADVAAVGIIAWSMLRGGSYFGEALVGASWTDTTVSPSTSYTYAVAAISFHGEGAPWSTAITIDTPSTNNIDPRRTGIKPLGSYWGASPEQVDMASGNLNLTIPVIQAQGRGGWTVPFSLSYNSQNWEKNSAGVELLSRDVGYGMGVRMMAGSLTPYWTQQSQLIDHYLYIDSTGAEYRLYAMPGGPANIWTSQLWATAANTTPAGESIYVYYDSNAGLLHFRDGSFWVMGCTSSGEEPDAGTMYPTEIEDRNGNQVSIAYEDGINTTFGNSSARIASISDTRASGRVSYGFQYYAMNASGVPHLQQITNNIGTDENYVFGYSNPLTITDPFSAGASYQNITELSTVTDQINFVRGLQYDAQGEVLAFTLPNGGYLRWTYAPNTYSWSSPSNNVVELNAVSNRYLATASSASGALNLNTPTYASEWAYNFSWENYAVGQSVIPDTCVADVNASAMRCWAFNTGQVYGVDVIGLAANVWRFSTSGGNTLLRNDELGYWQDPAGNLYVNVDTTIDTTGPSPLYSQKSQSVDQYGNVTQSSVWDWNSTQPSTTSGWTRQYNSTFQNACSSPFTGASGSNCAYVNRFVLNLLSTQKLTDSAGNSVTLATNTYDGYQTHAMLAVTGITEFDTSYSTSFLTRGNLTTSVAPSGTTNTYYDQTGMSTGADDGNGHAVAVTQAAGTNNSAPGLIQPNTGGSNDANLATSMTYSSFLGVASATTPNSSLTTIAYDSYGRPLTAVAPTGASTGYAYAFGATANGNISDGAYTTTATTNYHWTKTVTDGLGRTANSMAGYLTGGTPTQVSQVDTYYEACACSPAGKAWKISQPYAPAGTQAFTTYTYDALGRPLTVTLPDGASKTTYSYAGNWTSVVDPAGNWKQYETDVFGNTLEVVEPDPGYSPLVTSPPATPGTGSGILVTNYTYDFVSHLTNVSMVRAGTTQTRTWTYSPTTLLLSNTTSPETGTASANGTTSYTYNADGTLITRTDPLGQVTTYSYDSYQRVTQVTHGSDATQTYNYTYDTGTNGFGRLTQVTWGGTCSGTIPVYTETYSYTVAGQVSGKTLTVAKMVHGGCVQATATGAFAYDNEGKPTGTTYPEFITGLTGPTATYSYDNMSRLTGVTDTNELDVTACTSGAGSVIWASGGTYNAAGQLVGVQRLQSVSGCAPATPLYFNQAWTYNGLNQLTAIETSTQSNGYPTGSTNPGMAGTFFAQYFYSSTQNNGQIGSMTDARTGNTVSYTYDLLKRVTGATATGGTAWNQTFGYDGFGNLTSKSVPSGSSEFPLPGVNAAKNWLNGSSYDADGNVLTLNNATLGYDMENRLHNYTTGTFVENYAYDEGNKRVEKYSASSDVVYFYGPDGKLLSVLKVNILANSPWMTLSTVTNRIYFGGMLLGTSTGYASGDSDLIKDRLGSAKPSYPYGTDIGTQAGDGDDFATYWKDASSGFEYAMNRYYSAAYGRFLTVDPFGGSAKAGAPGSWNRYAYTSGDPANGNDPGGLDSEVCVSQDGSYAPPQCYMIADGASYQLCPTCYVTSTTNTESVTVDGGPPDQVPYDASANPSDLGVSGSAPGSNGSQGGSAGVGAVGGQVYLICQPVTTGIAWQDTVACVFNLQHCWLSTGTVAAGMGPADNGPLPNNPLGIPVAITDQSGQGGGNATLLPNVDPACVNAALQIGKPLGTWGPTNNCNTFAQSVISSCQIPGTKPPPCQIGLASCSAAF